jgi:hypothetical protein
MNRRELLYSLPALALVPRIFGQASKPTISVKAFNQFTLLVSDVKRSVDFYQAYSECRYRRARALRS